MEIAGAIVVVLLAAAVGGAAGWLAARRGRVRDLAAAREEATAGTLSLADDLYARTQRLQVVEGRLARANEQLSGRSGARIQPAMAACHARSMSPDPRADTASQ